MTARDPVVFLVDVDNTLLDNDHIAADLKRHLEHEVGHERQERYCFQPRKIERSGIRDVVDGNVLIYIHKERELDDVEQRYPADHYVLVDDKPR